MVYPSSVGLVDLGRFDVVGDQRFPLRSQCRPDASVIGVIQMNHLLPIGWTAAGRTGTPLRVAPAGERGTGVPLANYARRAGPPYPALFLAVTALCMGKGIVIMAKFLARRRPRPEANALDSLEIPVACHGGRNNRLDDQLAEPGFPNIDDPVMGPPVRVGRGGGRGPDTPAALRRPPRCPPLPSSPLRIRRPNRSSAQTHKRSSARAP